MNHWSDCDLTRNSSALFLHDYSEYAELSESVKRFANLLAGERARAADIKPTMMIGVRYFGSSETGVEVDVETICVVFVDVDDG